MWLMKRTLLYTITFILMTLIAAFDFVLFVGRLVLLMGRWVPFIIPLPIVALGSYVEWVVGKGLGIGHDEAINMGIAVSIISGFLLLIFFLL